MENRTKLIKNISIIFIFLNFLLQPIPRHYSLPKKNIQNQYAALSCKVDSFYYALQYFVDKLEPIEWFVDKVPRKIDKYLMVNIDGSYSISDPTKAMIGGFYSQQARFSNSRKLTVLSNGKSYLALFDKDNFIDVKEIYKNYGRIISFGLDNELLIKTFKGYLFSKNISYDFFNLKNPTVDDVSMLFSEIIFRNSPVVINGIAGGFKNPRTFNFKIIGSNDFYKWKEDSHSYVLIGYDLDKHFFIAADNYGTIDNPYKPAFRTISFEELYSEITLTNKNKLDKCYYLFRK